MASSTGIGFGIIFPILLTLVILLGPFLKALEEKDLNELLVDFIIIAFFWSFYFLIAQVELNDILNRIFN